MFSLLKCDVRKIKCFGNVRLVLALCAVVKSIAGSVRGMKVVCALGVLLNEVVVVDF